MSDKITECPNTNCRSPITAKTIDDLGRCVHCGLDYSAGGLEKSEVARLRTALAESREREDNMRVLKEDAVKDAERAEAALTESRREVEEAKDFVYKMNPSPMYVMTALAELVEHRKHQFASGLNIYAWKEKAERLEAENATLRQEVEQKQKDLDRHAGLNAYLLSKPNGNGGWKAKAIEAYEEREALRRQVEEQAASLEKVTRSWEEQAGKLAEAEKARKEANPWDSEKRAMAAEKDRDTALRDLAFEREERLDYGHLMRSLAESRAEVERVRQDHLAQAKVDGETITRLVEQRDAALSRAEAAEQERDEFSRQLVWRQSDGERKLREHIDEARLIAARSGFCYYCQASEGAAHAEFCRAFPTPPESEATRLRRQVEEQAAKLEVHERGIREASAMYNAEKQYRERAESSLAAAQEQVKALAAVNVINAALDKDLGDRNHDLALAMDALAAMTRERDQAREIGESERLSKMRREEDLAAIRTQSRREREALNAIATGDVPLPDYCWDDWNGSDARSEVVKIIAAFATAALSPSPAEPKEGA
jgi:hypothetical protein